MEEHLFDASHNPSEPFSHTPLTFHQFRILTITSDGQNLGASIQNFSLDHPPYYFALSWSWPQPDDIAVPHKTILCDGKDLSISDHLYNGLRNLCPTDSSCGFRIWIDEICIDQTNNAEKEVQVALMATIYSRASSVLVWLGEGSNTLETTQHEVTIRAILKSLRPGNKDFSGVPHFTDPAWRSIQSLFQSRWFERLWVFQEVLQAQQVDFLYINYLISWHAILQLRQLPWHASDDAAKEAGIKVREGQNSIIILRVMRESFRKDGDLNYLHLSGVLLRFKKVQRPVDRVYAVFSLLDKDTQDKISIDYSDENQRDYWNLYMQLAKASFEICGAHTVQYAESVDRPPELPSWCPNWNSPSNVMPVMSGKLFRAGGKFSRDVPRYKVETLSDSTHIRVHGFRLDRVKSLHTLGVPIPYWAFNMLNIDSKLASCWIEQESCCLQLASDSISDLVEAKHAHLRNLTWNSISDGVLIAESDWPRVMRVYDAVLQLFQDAVNGRLPKVYGWNEDMYAIIAQIEAKAVAKRFARPYFVTEHGRLGRGVPGMQVGDEICVLYGTTAPILLRFNKSSDMAAVIGDVYLDGCMHLDTMLEEGRGKDEVFILV